MSCCRQWFILGRSWLQRSGSRGLILVDMSYTHWTIVDPILSCLQPLVVGKPVTINQQIWVGGCWWFGLSFFLLDVVHPVDLQDAERATEVPTPRMTQEAHVSPGCARASKQRGTKIPRFRMAHNSGAIGTCGSRSEFNLKLKQLVICCVLWGDDLWEWIVHVHLERSKTK